MNTLLLLALLAPQLQWPVEGRITSTYGPRWGQHHAGIDISAWEGAWVRAADSGKVIFAGEYGNYGNLVAVRHKDGLVTYYAHLQNFCVFKWQRVERGQKLGRVGMTGRATGPHLHFEVRVDKKAHNPMVYLPPHRDSLDGDPQAVGGP